MVTNTENLKEEEIKKQNEIAILAGKTCMLMSLYEDIYIPHAVYLEELNKIKDSLIPLVGENSEEVEQITSFIQNA